MQRHILHDFMRALFGNIEAHLGLKGAEVIDEATGEHRIGDWCADEVQRAFEVLTMVKVADFQTQFLESFIGVSRYRQEKLTGAIFPFKAFAVIILGLTQQGIGETLDINFFTWTLYNTIICLAMIALFLLVCKFVLRPDLSRVKETGAKSAHLRGQKMNKEQKIGTVVLVIFILALALPSILPDTIPGVAVLEEMSILGVGTLCLVGLTLVKKEDGEPYVKIPHLISNGVNWELIILIASTMPICNALEAEECGVLQSVIAWMTATFSGLSGTMFLVAISALFLITTQVTHNLVLILVFTPVLTQMGLQFGVNPAVVMLLIFYTTMTAYATPAASSNATLIFGNEKWVNRKDAYLVGFLILLVAFVVVIGIGIPLGNVLL